MYFTSKLTVGFTSRCMAPSLARDVPCELKLANFNLSILKLDTTRRGDKRGHVYIYACIYVYYITSVSVCMCVYQLETL